ncbi:winged helix-turn-helix domain-containing protein [Streptomyces parvulus]|uniref:ArsR/SmtB family transcription factor n=1 Tax=Streptomyces parvulus TaxID=146923 RepID=UPI001E3272C5|nr:winged helix-turn-helix domain-containing protein [Streptomyces parvulus]MCC9155898.1 winged helix-turn-helix domain-containing protein [Streptomyces parvulus]MCE7688320.1 winged helix-turn-helix domain-containing protein [Streptomyces parvulus]
MADLERRLAALEEAGERPAPRPGEGDFWALEGLKEQLAELGAADGGVLFTGTVRLPTGEQYAWQHGALTEGLLDADWAESAEVFAALGHPVRLRLLREILGGRRTAAELAELDGVGTTGQIYHHLRQLTGAGWLHAAGRGRHEVPPGRVVPLLVALSTARH